MEFSRQKVLGASRIFWGGPEFGGSRCRCNIGAGNALIFQGFLGGGGGFLERIKDFGAGPVNAGFLRLLKGKAASVKAVSRALQSQINAAEDSTTSTARVANRSEKDGFGTLYHI